MLNKTTEKEYKLRIDKVIDYILQNLNNDISLEALSGVANYSPFHLQKIFKQIIGETPKQYIIKLRLETALHLMVIHPHKSIIEVSIDCGFSSPSVFSRAIKHFFGISPEEMRRLSPKEKIKVFRSKNPKFLAPQTELHSGSAIEKPIIQIKRINTIRGFYLSAVFDDTSKIQQSFKEVIQLANTYDLLSGHTKVYGIVNPHHCNVYRTFVSIPANQSLSNKFNVTEIKAGKYASFKIRGDKKETLKAAHFFYHKWLPGSGYRIGDVVGFETFTGSPELTPYNKLERDFYIPIVPV